MAGIGTSGRTVGTRDYRDQAIGRVDGSVLVAAVEADEAVILLAIPQAKNKIQAQEQASVSERRVRASMIA
jgi:hypothetical protein